jgi:glycosyltransferase involved in cell wall biosynthesis
LKRRVTLGIVYHMPCWRAADGTLREVEGSFARYVDSLAPYFDEISLCVPVSSEPRGEGTPIRSSNVTLAPLPFFDGPAQFYPRLLGIAPRLARWARQIDLLHCRVPTPAAVFAFACARVARRPAFLLVVGDLRALLPVVPYRGMKRALWRLYVSLEERSIQWMVERALTFANGRALVEKHQRGRELGHVIETTTTTIRNEDIASRIDTCDGVPSGHVRAFTVSRIEPRKGLRVLPAALDRLASMGLDLTLDIVGPTVGRPGGDERDALLAEAENLGVKDRIALLGAVPLERLLPLYRNYDLFVLPTLPGEGIPRVLLEAMSAGLPVVTTRVAGIPSLITHEDNGLLVDAPTPASMAAAIARIVREPILRQRLIANGYETARRFTLERQSARMMEEVSDALHIALRHPVVLPAA